MSLGAGAKPGVRELCRWGPAGAAPGAVRGAEAVAALARRAGAVRGPGAAPGPRRWLERWPRDLAARLATGARARAEAGLAAAVGAPTGCGSLRLTRPAVAPARRCAGAGCG